VSEPRPPTLPRAVLGAHGLITLAGAAVLTVWPAAIPEAVGISLQRSDFLVVYLIGAAELVVAVLSFGAMQLTDRSALRLVITTLVVLHAASGLLNVQYLAQTGSSTVLIANTCARAAAVAVLLVVWRVSAHQTWGTNR
jgi:hypothetical protein